MFVYNVDSSLHYRYPRFETEVTSSKSAYSDFARAQPKYPEGNKLPLTTESIIFETLSCNYFV